MAPPDSTVRPVTPLQIYQQVSLTGLPNYKCARIPLQHQLHIPIWRHYLTSYSDNIICDFLEYGWPANYDRSHWPTSTFNNHSSALAYPVHVQDYLQEETYHNAMLGPFAHPPFPMWQINPMMTKSKKGSDTKRRVIVDLSWPHGSSVNDGICKDYYLGEPITLKYPTVDTLVAHIIQHGTGCLLFSVDLARAYRQWRSDPLDWPLLGLKWNNSYYFDMSIPFGLRPGAMICQRVTDAIRYILHQDNIMVVNYIDDFAGIATPSQAHTHFNSLRSLLQELGVQESEPKATEPSSVMTWIGIEFNTLDMTLKMPQDKISETLKLVREWGNKTTATRHQLQHLLGKLHHISKCVKPGRLFVSRLLHTLQQSYHSSPVTLDANFHKDLNWFENFLPSYNGIQMMCHPPHTNAGHTLTLDACLTGCGAIYGYEYYSTVFPDFVLANNHHIAHLELLNIVVAAKIWGCQWRNTTITVYCDNTAAVSVLTTGRGRDPYLLSCAREIFYLSVVHQFTLHPQHMPGRDMMLADSLSRAHMSPSFQAIYKSLLPDNQYHSCDVDARLFKLTANI